VSNLVAGPNLLRTGSGVAANVFAAAGYSSASSNAAMTAGHYWETVIAPDSGYSISFDSILYRFRRANSGPQWAQWAYSTNGVDFVWLTPEGSNRTTYVDKETPLSGVTALQSRTSRVWFRMYAWAGGAANDAYGAYGQNADVLTFSGTIDSAGPVFPTVSFNPSGAQSIAVSNELTLAVSATPAGSGIQSWNMVPAYSGAASLVSGNFSFTPAGADNGKNLTLSVIATNSVGARTGTVSITVTPYVVPVPTITFNPPAPYGIMATRTQTVGIAVTPAGSGISSWSLLPAYSGSASLIGTNFSFTPAESDAPVTYTLTVVATNVHGASTGTAEIAVSEYVPAPPPGSVVVDFEDGPNKTSYAPATNTLSGR
jgi:hypothetical protein